MKKKICIVLGIILVAIIVVGNITNYVDSGRVGTGHEPKYCIKLVSNDGSKVTYWGLGYKVVRYVGVSPNEPYESNIGVKIGSWFMNYELPESDIVEIKYEGQTITITDIKDIGIIENILVNSKYNNEICDGINTHKITINNDVYYIKESCKEIQKGDKQATISIEDLKIINNIIYDKINSEKKSYSKKIDETTIELDIPNEWNYEEIKESKNDNFKFALSFYKSSKERNATLYFYNDVFGVCGTGLTNEKIILHNGKEANVGYYDGNKDWNFISFYELNRNVAFINNGLDSNEAKEVLEFAKTININNDQSKNEPFFYGKVIESHDSYIIVEPNEGEEERKSADKISVSLGKYNDCLYEVGTNVKITYDGTIMESYPAQVKATKIEIKSAENFEILFYDKHPMESYKIYTILDKSETYKYDYTIYGYDGSVNIRIDGKDYSLKEALLQNKITINEIIAKANQDEKDGKIKVDMYKDGGSTEYHYDNYTIIKCHTLDGNRDVYIGTKDLKLTDVI